jgi:putative chitinase
MTTLHTKYRTLLNNYQINTPLRLAHFFAQLHHESNLKPISENLNYSAAGLLRIFPKYFNQITAADYARQPQRIANRVYANRMGNGNEASGDGWLFRGRGFIQLTGRDNYLRFSKDSRLPEIMTAPDLLLNEVNAMISALWFWQTNRLNRFSDIDDVRKLTKAINGGFNGLDHRIKLTNQYKKFFKV